MKNPYEDIIALPRHVSPTRPQMSMRDRAAQFASFAALTGFDDAIRETGRLTDEKPVLSEEARGLLNRKLQRILAECPEAELEILYFVPDGKKAGGACRTVTGRIRQIDEIGRTIVLSDRTAVPMEDVLDIRLKSGPEEQPGGVSG